MTCCKGQVFLGFFFFALFEAWSEWRSVCSVRAQMGFKMVSQTQIFKSSFPWRRQWGNLMCMVTCCQSGSSIRNCFELNWKSIELLFLDWIKLNLSIEVNLLTELNNWTQIGAWNLNLRCYVFFFFILSSYDWSVIWNVVHFENWRYFLTCNRQKKS